MKGVCVTLSTALVFCVGLILGAYYPSILSALGFEGVAHHGTHGESRLSDRHGVHLTNPLLECAEQPEGNYSQNLNDVEDILEGMVDAAKKRGDVSFASVYFRDLNNGPWFGVNESEEFFPASLLKLPLVMSFYWLAEDDPAIMQQEVTYTPDPSVLAQTQPYGPKANVEDGKKYTVEELIEITLKESSNEAAVALANVAGEEQIASVYNDLGLKAPTFGSDYRIDTHDFSSFFRILYNATYLDRKDSENVLNMLTETSFRDGLVAGVPEGTTVAHKFGSRKVDDAGKVQLHDCGIVYAPEKPYILCVMTQGTDFTKLSNFIKDISSRTYQEITRD